MNERQCEARCERRQAVARLLANRGDLLAVAGLGSPAWDLMAAGDHDRNFYLWGAMGGAAMTGLGLALAQPSFAVLVLTGDGEQLMGLGGLATIGVQQPPNLTVVVLDNGRYGETGNQSSHTATAADLPGVARACGLAWTMDIAAEPEIDLLAARIHRCEGCGFARIAVDATVLPKVLPPRDGVHLKNRFRASLGFGVL